jgi:hypothetical protein
MDNVMVDAMRQYNMTAQRMGLPDKSKEIENLSSDIQSRFNEVNELQQALSEATDPFNTGLLKEEDEDELMMELNALSENPLEMDIELRDEDEEIEIKATSTNEINKSTKGPEQQLRQRLVSINSNTMEPKNNEDFNNNNIADEMMLSSSSNTIGQKQYTSLTVVQEEEEEPLLA